jgi:hypothetical protein
MVVLSPWQARPVLGNRGNVPARVLARCRLFHGHCYVRVLAKAVRGLRLHLDLSQYGIVETSPTFMTAGIESMASLRLTVGCGADGMLWP